MHHFGTPKVGVASVAPISKVRASAMLLLPITEMKLYRSGVESPWHKIQKFK